MQYLEVTSGLLQSRKDWKHCRNSTKVIYVLSSFLVENTL